MKFFLLFCAIYSVSLFADNPKKLEKAKRTIVEVDHRVRNSINDLKKALKKKS